VDTEEFYAEMADFSKTSIEKIRSENYEFICSDCAKTDTYRNDYFSSKPHAVLAEEAAVINN
jgi:hypothetical protein